jgi:hypothetical protein
MGITKLKPDDIDDDSLRIVIEEAALTSVGCQNSRYWTG